jgi:beta-xylosidase
VVSDLTAARNTLTQRPFAKRNQNVPTIAVTKLDVSKMKNGDFAGLAIFQDPYAYIAVKQGNGARYIVMVDNGKVVDSASVDAAVIYLRTLASNATRKASFEYSTDDKIFHSFGGEFTMRFSLKIFTGNKFCLFNYATRQTGGYVDFDWFRVQ